MSDEQLPNEPEQTADDSEVDAEASALSIDVSGNKMVPLSALIAAKKEGKGYRDKLKELEPVAARTADVDQRLATAQPIINAILQNPKLRAEALRIAQGTNTSSERTEQPAAEDDPDAAAYAEDAGFYLADGQTPDIARARRVLTRLDQRHGRQTDERMRPLAGITLNRQAEGNLQQAMAQTDDDGTPLATAESIREVAGLVPSHLLADPKVVDLILNSAIGLDRRKHRTPKAPDEPLYLESAGGGRQRGPSISPEERRSLERLGLTEKDYTESTKRLEEGMRNRRGIVLGGR